MKQKAFLLKSLMVIGLLGCTVSVYAQSYDRMKSTVAECFLSASQSLMPMLVRS